MSSSQIPKKMKAAVLYDVDDVRVEERDVPVPGYQEVLLKVDAASICGTDIKVMHRQMGKQPEDDFIMGHEYSGTIAAVGDGVDEFKIGDRVAVEIHKGCGHCENCIKGDYTACLNYGEMETSHRANGLTCDGGFAQYALNHINTLYKLPDNVSFDDSVLVTTAGCVMWGIDRLGGYMAGDTVLVIGPGPIGLMAVQCCKALGANPVILTGTRESRLKIGREVGADYTINVKEEDMVKRVMEITGGKGAEIVMECAGGEDSLQEAVETVKRGGKICMVAFYKKPVTADMSHVARSNVNIYTCRGEGGMNCGRSLSLMSEGKIAAAPLITHHFSLGDIHQAIKTFVERIDDAIKVVIYPNK